MKKIYSLFIAAGLISASTIQTQAQCAGSRYHDFVFPATPTPTSNVSYGSNVRSNGTTQNLLLDIYEPVGDIATSRPLVLVFHGGSFIGGSKTGTDVVPICRDLARLGYVAVSVEYRVGMTRFPFPGPDSTDAAPAVVRGVHDARAAVRFFRKNAAIGGNTYRIDPNNIYMLGVSAGGFIALQTAYMDDINELPSYIDTVAQPGIQGGIQGLSGNPGYSSDVNAVVNICGAVGDTAWIHPGDEPVLSFHGTNDNTVPYGSAMITLSGVWPIMQVDGSFSINARVDQMGIENCFEIYEGQDHVPHVSNAAYYDTTLTITRNFLEHFVCGVALNCNYTTAPVVGINELSVTSEDVDIYPNPANSSFVIDLIAFASNSISIEMYDVVGKKVRSINSTKASKFTIDKENLQSGIYFVKITSKGKSITKKVVFE